jgi:hypothetical protein
MKIAALSLSLFLGLALGAVAAQDAPPDGPPPSQNSGGPGHGGMGAGRGITGSVTAVAADHYTIKTDAGASYTVQFSANTRIFKQPAQHQDDGGRTAPQALKASDIKVGDALVAIGEVDSSANSVGAIAIIQVDPERAKQLSEAQANFGKTWLMGKVTAIDETKVTLMSMVDNAAHTFVTGQSTTFRKRHQPITLADVQVGDMVRVEGAIKSGSFLATSVNVMGMPQMPRDGAPTAPPL